MELTRIRLAILSILVVLIQYCSGENEGMETEINWERCKKPANEPRAETKCYVMKKCRITASTQMYFEKLSDPDDLPKIAGKGVCETGIQFKPYSKMKWLVYMQVKKEATDQPLVPADGVWIEANAEKYFGCKKTANANAEYFGSDNIGKEKYTNGKDEFTADRIFCSFVITGLADTLDQILIHNGAAEFKFKTDAEQTYDMQSNLRSIASEVDGSITCDPDEAKFDSKYNNVELITYKTQIIKQSKNQCPESKGKLFVKYKSSKDEFVEVTDIECKWDNNDYKFVYIPKNPITPTEARVIITKKTPFNVHCAAKACSLCSKLATDGMPAGDANYFESVPTPGNIATGDCVKAKCASDSWEYESVNGDKKTIVSSIACKKDGEKAAWFLEGNNAEVKKAWCSKKINCFSKNPLKFSCPPKDSQEYSCAASNSTEPPKFSCTTKVMYKSEKEQPVPTEGITCQPDSGDWMSAEKKSVPKDSFVYCQSISAANMNSTNNNVVTGSLLGGILGGVLGLILLVVIVVWAAAAIRRYRKYSPSERQQRIRPKWKWYHKFYPAKLVTEDLAILKEWDENVFNTILEQWLKFSIYERYKFAERVGFELGVGSNCEYFFTLFSKVFEIETDYRVWQNLVPVFKLLHAQAADKENNLDCDKRMRKWCISKCKKIVEKVGWEGCNNEFRETAYQRYIVFNLMYYCEDKDFTEKLLEFFDKGQFHGLHSINRQVAWAAAVRDKDQFEVAVKVADEAVCDKNAKREIAEKRAKMNGGKKASASEKTDNGKTDWSIKSSKSSKGGASSKDKKGGPGTSKESKSSASQGGSKSNNSNKSNRSNKSNKDKKDKSGKDKKGSKETPSGKAKKGDSKEASKSSKRDKKDKGGSKEAKKGSREKGGADEKVESGKEKKEQPSDKDKKTKSGKDKKDKSSKEKTASGKEKKDKSSKSSKEKKDKSGKDKKSSKEKKSEKTCQSSKSGKSSKEKKNDSKKSVKEKTAIDKSSKSKKSTMSKKKKKPTKIGYKERKDADGDKLHGDRAQHVFFAIGSSRNKEQIAAFLDYYVEHKEYDPSNLVYLFAATLEWDDTRSYGLDLFLNMNKKAFIKMPPGNKYHMRILKNFRRYVIGELDLQKLQSHIVKDPNYNVKHFAQLELSLMLKRIHNNVTYQEKLIDDLDSALKKMNF